MPYRILDLINIQFLCLFLMHKYNIFKILSGNMYIFKLNIILLLKAVNYYFQMYKNFYMILNFYSLFFRVQQKGNVCVCVCVCVCV